MHKCKCKFSIVNIILILLALFIFYLFFNRSVFEGLTNSTGKCSGNDGLNCSTYNNKPQCEKNTCTWTST